MSEKSSLELDRLNYGGLGEKPKAQKGRSLGFWEEQEWGNKYGGKGIKRAGHINSCCSVYLSDQCSLSCLLFKILSMSFLVESPLFSVDEGLGGHECWDWSQTMGSTGPDVHGVRDWKECGSMSNRVNSSNGPAKKTSSACYKLNLETSSGSCLTSLGQLDLAGHVLF